MNDDPYDRFDPDCWLAQGKHLQHFRPSGPDAELFYEAHPELRRRAWRWWNMVVQASHRAAYERDVSIPVEDDLRDLWRVVKSKTSS